MKNLLKLFGILDLISIIRFLTLKQLNNFGDGNFIWTQVFLLILGLSLFFTAYFLIRNKVVGIWIYYAQFVPRLMVSFGLSFGFIFWIFDLFKVTLNSNNTLFIILYFLEAIRLTMTIIIHRQLYFKTKNASL